MDVRTHPVCDPETFERNLRAEGSRFSLVNGNFYLAAGHDDDTSVLGHPEQGWGWLMDRGFDIIQTVLLRTPEALIAFCQGMQAGAPVDSFVVPEPWDMPGYDSQVIMAAGAFTMGSSIELSADAPLREPYAAWMQGGFNFHSAKTGVMLAAQAMHDRGLI